MFQPAVSCGGFFSSVLEKYALYKPFSTVCRMMNQIKLMFGHKSVILVLVCCFSLLLQTIGYLVKFKLFLDLDDHKK